MIVLKIVAVFLLVLAVRAEKKIELQDIEEDNLRSEKEKELEKSDGQTASPGQAQLDLLKSSLLRYLNSPTPTPTTQLPRYVQQYAVTEAPESPAVLAKPQPALMGYLSGFPLQIYLVPQYERTPAQLQHLTTHATQQYQFNDNAGYQTVPVQAPANYLEIPSYVQGSGILSQYSSPGAVVGYTPNPQEDEASPAVTYQLPGRTFAPVDSKGAPNYQLRQEYVNNGYEYEENEDEDGEQRHYSTRTEAPSRKEYPRHYNSRTPIREDYRPLDSNAIEIPHPHPLLLKGPRSYSPYTAKTLPAYHRPVPRPLLYQAHHSNYSPIPLRRRPTSLLDSYIPSTVQIEYLKKGIVKDPGAVYEALASGRLPHPIPQRYERGFLPNQMYQTAAGGVTFGHYKRTPKLDKIPQKQ